MYKTEALEDFGQWCKKGEIYNLNNNIAESLSRKGILKIIEFLGNCDGMTNSVYEIKRRIKQLDRQIETLEKKREGYKEHLKHVEKSLRG